MLLFLMSLTHKFFCLELYSCFFTQSVFVGTVILQLHEWFSAFSISENIEGVVEEKAKYLKKHVGTRILAKVGRESGKQYISRSDTVVRRKKFK